MTKTQAQSPKAETPFGLPTWSWAHVPAAGHSTRSRSQAVVTNSEREAAEKLIAAYRAQEKTAADHSIEVRQAELRLLSGIGAELMRRELANCDHGLWQKSQERLSELRQEALALSRTILKRLARSLDDELTSAAIAAEQKLDSAGISIRGQAHLDSAGRHVEGEWLLHGDAVCRALWSQRVTVERKLSSLDEGAAIGVIQFLASDEDPVPFTWA